MRFNHRNNRFDHQKSLSPPVDVKNPKTRGRMGHTVTTLTPFDKCIWCIWIVSGCSFALRLKKKHRLLENPFTHVCPWFSQQNIRLWWIFQCYVWLLATKGKIVQCTWVILLSMFPDVSAILVLYYLKWNNHFQKNVFVFNSVVSKKSGVWMFLPAPVGIAIRQHQSTLQNHWILISS